MLLFIHSILSIYNKNNCSITSTKKILRPLGQKKYVTLGSSNLVSDLILMSGSPSVLETVTFNKKEKCSGYWIFVNTKPFCYDMNQPVPTDCKTDADKFMMWDVVNEKNGFAICTSSGYGYLIGKYFYEYCLTYNLGNDRLSIERPNTNYENQLFEIFEKKNEEKIPVIVESLE